MVLEKNYRMLNSTLALTRLAPKYLKNITVYSKQNFVVNTST